MRRTGQRRGQALVMVTLSLFAICGMIGLAVDLGWNYFTAKAARGAADAAALAAVRRVYDDIGAGTYTCGGIVTCQSPALECSTLTAGNNLYNGCLYAQRNGFDGITPAARKKVMMQSGTSSPVAVQNGGLVYVHYWVTATATEVVPQLFSAVLGNVNGISSAKATAAVVDSVVHGSLIILNRQNDLAYFGNSAVYGIDLNVQANDNQGAYALETSGGIILSSTCAGTSSGAGNCLLGNQPTYAGVNQGGGTVSAPSTEIRKPGWYSLQGGSQWTQTPVQTTGPQFNDPMSDGRGQPPPPTGLTNVPVLDGVLDSTVCPSGVCLPGNYYAVNSGGAATGDQIVISGNIRFAACNGCSPGTGFGNYVIFGGIKGGNSSVMAQFDPGRYVLAGVKPKNNGDPGVLIDTSTNFFMTDATSGYGQNSDAGELFILTDTSYIGQGTQLQIPAAVQALPAGTLRFGTSQVQAGNNGTYVNLHGLNTASASVPAELRKFNPVLMWQDQQNSNVKYTTGGYVDTSCNGGSLDNPCTNSLASPKSPELQLQASPSLHLYGAIYQPRGAWTTVTGAGRYTGPLQLITGAMNIQGNARLNLTGPTMPLTTTIVTLIE